MEELNEFEEFKVCNVFREANREAYTLSKWATSLIEDGKPIYELCSRWEILEVVEGRGV